MGVNHSMYPYVKPFDNLEPSQDNTKIRDLEYVYVLCVNYDVKCFSQDINCLIDKAKNISKSIIRRSMTSFGSNFMFYSEEIKKDDSFSIRIYSRQNNTLNARDKLENIIHVNKIYRFKQDMQYETNEEESTNNDQVLEETSDNNQEESKPNDQEQEVNKEEESSSSSSQEEESDSDTQEDQNGEEEQRTRIFSRSEDCTDETCESNERNRNLQDIKNLKHICKR